MRTSADRRWPSRSAASITSGWAEQTEVTPTASPAARRRPISARRCVAVVISSSPTGFWPTAIQASISARLDAPSIGPCFVTARAPAALAKRNASSGASPRNHSVTKAAPKQSPAPVGSTSSTAKAGMLATARPIVVDGAVDALLDDDRADAAREDLGDRGALLVGLGEQIKLGAARQEQIGLVQHLGPARRACPTLRAFPCGCWGRRTPCRRAP